MRGRLWNPFVGNPEGDASAFESTPGHIHVARGGWGFCQLRDQEMRGGTWAKVRFSLCFSHRGVGPPPPGVITSKQSKRDPCHLKINIFFFFDFCQHNSTVGIFSLRQYGASADFHSVVSQRNCVHCEMSCPPGFGKEATVSQFTWDRWSGFGKVCFHSLFPVAFRDPECPLLV